MSNFRVMRTHEFEKSVYYRISCDCGDKDCDLVLEFEQDENLSSFVFLNLYKDLFWSSCWGTNNWFQEICKRIKASLRILFIGYIKVEQSLVLRGGGPYQRVYQSS